MFSNRQKGILVYSIGIGEAKASPGAGFSIGNWPFRVQFGRRGEEEVDPETLQTLLQETGAKTFIISEVGDGESLRQRPASRSATSCASSIP